jgi:hypothetical protein
MSFIAPFDFRVRKLANSGWGVGAAALWSAAAGSSRCGHGQAPDAVAVRYDPDARPIRPGAVVPTGRCMRTRPLPGMRLDLLTEPGPHPARSAV